MIEYDKCSDRENFTEKLTPELELSRWLLAVRTIGIGNQGSGKIVQVEETATTYQVARIEEVVVLVKKTDIMDSGLMELKCLVF